MYSAVKVRDETRGRLIIRANNNAAGLKEVPHCVSFPEEFRVRNDGRTIGTRGLERPTQERFDRLARADRRCALIGDYRLTALACKNGSNGRDVCPDVTQIGRASDCRRRAYTKEHRVGVAQSAFERRRELKPARGDVLL